MVEKKTNELSINCLLFKGNIKDTNTSIYFNEFLFKSAEYDGTYIKKKIRYFLRELYLYGIKKVHLYINEPIYCYVSKEDSKSKKLDRFTNYVSQYIYKYSFIYNINVVTYKKTIV